jgi:CubicO group peptidase (beta-lactamase class C family)
MKTEDLDAYIEQARADWKNVGLAVAIVENGELAYARGFGVREYRKPLGVDADTLFQVGSTTKAFTTAALGLLVEEGRLHWDDPVIEHLPRFQLQDPWITRHLTIRDAVAHRSGVSVTLHPFLSVMDTDEAIAHLRHVTPEGPFRDSFLYNNLLYAAAGKVVESASGMPWSTFLSERLLRPLGMSRSAPTARELWDRQHITGAFFGSAPSGRPSLDDARDANVAMPHGWDEQGAIHTLPWQTYDNAAAAGTLVSSASDMARWLALHLNEGQQILAKETRRELHAPQNLHSIPQYPFERETESYTLGWFRAAYRGCTHLEHGGGIIGFPAYMAILPERKAGIVVLSNGSGAARERLGLPEKMGLHKGIAFWVFDRLLGAEAHDWSRDFLGRAAAADKKVDDQEIELQRARLRNAPHGLPLEQYSGAYGELPVKVSMEGGQLTLSFPGPGAYAGRLEHWHQDLFRLRSQPGVADVFGPQFVSFNIDGAGKVASLAVFGKHGGTLDRQRAT